MFKANYFEIGSRIFLAYVKKRRMEITPFRVPNYVYVRLNSQKALKCLQITSYRHPAKIQFIAGHFSFTADQRIKPFFFGNTILKANDRRLPVPINKVTVRQYSDNQLRQQVAKLLRHFHQKTPFLTSNTRRI